jgi:subtilisin family serine protease
MTQGVDANGNPAANGKRFFFTFAAGNVFATTCDAGGPTKVYPATIGSQIDGAVTVGGTTRNDTIWSGSCRGAELYAPAEELLVAISSATNHYRAGPNFFPNSGTSWSAPIVAGIAARFLETNPSLTPPQLEARLLASAVPIGTTGERIPLFLPPPARQRSVRH